MDSNRSSEFLDYKTKYENSEKSLQLLKKYAHKAVSDYEDLQRNYDQNQKQYDDLKTRLQDTEYQLQQLQRALEPACEEYNELQDRYTIEQGCRTEAEKYAQNIVQQNQKLKRQSQMLRDTLGTSSLDIKQLDLAIIEESGADAEVTDGRFTELDAKVEQLEGLITSLKERIHELEQERETAAEKELLQTRQLDQYQDALKNAQDKILELERSINNYNTLSNQAVEEYASLKEEYEKQKALREEAEKYASKMLAQRDTVVRESTVVLASAVADKRLNDAFMQIEELQQLLETERGDNSRKIKDLEEELENSVSTKRIEDMETRLEVATEEISSKTKQIKEMEEWKKKLETDYQNLEVELDTTRQRLPAPPPPPPPPPPASLFNLFRPMKKKTDTAKKTEPAGGKRVSGFDKALQEMMDRIKSGKTLRVTNPQRRPSLPETSMPQKSNAMNELSSMLSKVKVTRSYSIDEGERVRTPTENGQADFLAVFNKIKGGGSMGQSAGNAVTGNLERISEEKDGETSPGAAGERSRKSSSGSTARSTGSTNF